MKMLALINQRASIAAGIDAPNSTELLHVPPMDLTQSQREFVAKNLQFQDGTFILKDMDSPVALVLEKPLTAYGNKDQQKAAVSSALDALIQRVTELQIAHQKKADDAKKAISEATLQVLREKVTRPVVTYVVAEIEPTGRVKFSQRKEKTKVSTETGNPCFDSVLGQEVEAAPAEVELQIRRPAWPKPCDPDILECQAAKEWVAELSATEHEQRLLAEDRALLLLKERDQEARRREEQAMKRSEIVHKAIEKYGTDLQRTRLSRGLLDLNDEGLGFIKKELFAAISLPISNSGLSGYQKSRVVSDFEMAQILDIESRVPGAKVEVYNQSGWELGYEDKWHRKFHVAIPWEGIVLTQVYCYPDETAVQNPPKASRTTTNKKARKK